jgi:hypothetical protein
VSAADGPRGSGRVPLATLREWSESPDPLLRHLAFHTAFAHPGDVPGLSDDERLKICLDFLEAGLAGTFGDSIPDGPYVLAHTTLGWLRQLLASGTPTDLAAASTVVSMLERVARAGPPAARDVIVLGVLEHAFEEPQTRAAFAGWADDPELGPLYREAVRLTS